MTTPPRAVHAIPLERDPDGRSHVPFVKCWCGPVDGFRAIGTGGAVFVHRPFGPSAPRPRHPVNRQPERSTP